MAKMGQNAPDLGFSGRPAEPAGRHFPMPPLAFHGNQGIPLIWSGYCRAVFDGFPDFHETEGGGMDNPVRPEKRGPKNSGSVARGTPSEAKRERGPKNPGSVARGTPSPPPPAAPPLLSPKVGYLVNVGLNKI